MNNKPRRVVLLAVIMFLLFLINGCSLAISDIMNMNQQQIMPKYKSGSELTYFIVTDLHYLAEALHDEGEAFRKYVDEGDGKQLNYISQITDAFVYDIENFKPEILIISGDLTNNGEKASHNELAAKLKRIENQGTDVYVIPGNHDILNPWARGFKEDEQYWTNSISSKDFSKIYSSFGYDEAISKDKDSLSYLAAPSHDIWLLMLDTSQYKSNRKLGSPQTDGVIEKSTIRWIKQCIELAKKNNAQIIPVMHHNLINHSDVIIKGYTLNNSQEMLELFDDNNIDMTLSGHIHIQDITSELGVYDIATGSMAVYPQQYGVLKYYPRSNSFSYSTQWVDVEAWAQSQEKNDLNLLNFKEYSKDSFGKLAFNMAYKHLNRYGSFDSEEQRLMAEAVRTLNLRYFAGTENENAEDLLDTQGFKLWENAKEGFLKSYIQSISFDRDEDDNSLLLQGK